MKPDREQFEQDVLAYVEGELSPDQAARMEVFLANTEPELAQRVAGMIADRKTLQSLPPLRAPTDLAERVMAQVERTSLLGDTDRELRDRTPRWWHSRYAVAASIAILLGGFGYFMFSTLLDVHRPPLASTDRPRTGIAMVGNRAKDANEQGLEEIPANLTIALAAANGQVDPSAAGFNFTDQPVDALQEVKAAPQSYTDGPPVVLVLNQATPADAERLQTKLKAMVLANGSAQPAGVANDFDLAQPAGAAALRDRAGNDTAPGKDDVGGDGVRSKLPAPNSRPSMVKGSNNKSEATADAAPTRGTMPTDRTLANNDQATAQGDRFTYQVAVLDAKETQEGIARSGSAAQIGKTVEPKKAPPHIGKTPAGDKASTAHDETSPEAVRFAGEPNAPYRVYLRADQLQELSHEFPVYAVTRGNTGYVINNGATSNYRNNPTSNSVAAKYIRGQTLNYGLLANNNGTLSVSNTSSVTAGQSANITAAPGGNIAGGGLVNPSGGVVTSTVQIQKATESKQALTIPAPATPVEGSASEYYAHKSAATPAPALGPSSSPTAQPTSVTEARTDGQYQDRSTAANQKAANGAFEDSHGQSQQAALPSPAGPRTASPPSPLPANATQAQLYAQDNNNYAQSRGSFQNKARAANEQWIQVVITMVPPANTLNGEAPANQNDSPNYDRNSRESPQPNAASQRNAPPANGK